MRKLFFLLISALISNMSYGQAYYGKVVNDTIQSNILGVKKPFVVYLPEGYDTNTEKKYPVLYLLHGASDDCETWIKNGDAHIVANKTIGAGMATDMIIVMPDARGENENNTGKNMGYFNQSDWSYENFFFEEFIPGVEERYRIIGTKKARAIAGLSMGGGGSAVYAQRHPEYFNSCAPLSGVLGSHKDIGQKRDSEYARSIDLNSPANFLRNATPEQIESLKTVRWYVDCGDDDFLAIMSVNFYTLMQQKGIPIEYRMRDGEHNWHYWRRSLEDVLTFVSIGFLE